MSTEAFVEVIERWAKEPAFRAELERDPKQAVFGTGMELEEEEWAALWSMVAS
jgi:hypothetical protein